MRPAILATLLLALGAEFAAAQVPVPGGPFPNAGPPLLLRLVGVIETAQDRARGKGFTVVPIGFYGSDARRWIGVEEARTFGGDQPLDGKDVLAIVAPFTPNFIVAGAESVVSRLRDAPAGSSVRVEGLVDLGSRTYLLRNVTVTGG